MTQMPNQALERTNNGGADFNFGGAVVGRSAKTLGLHNLHAKAGELFVEWEAWGAAAKARAGCPSCGGQRKVGAARIGVMPRMRAVTTKVARKGSGTPTLKPNPSFERTANGGDAHWFCKHGWRRWLPLTSNVEHHHEVLLLMLQ